MTDVIVASGATIQKYPDLRYAKDPQLVEWIFGAQKIFPEQGQMSLSYSFINTSATFITPGFAVIKMGNGAGTSQDGGISIAFEGPVSGVVAGADGTALTSVYAARNGTVTISLLKNSPANKLLSALAELTRQTPQTYGGQGIITIIYTE